MKKSLKLQLELSEKRQRANELLAKESLTGEERAELDGLTTRIRDAEIEYRAAVTVEETERAEAERRAGIVPDAEMRERIQLRSRARLVDYFLARASGRQVTGAEAELCAAAGVAADQIPLELWDTPRAENRAQDPGAVEHRAITAAPGTVGLNLAPVQPGVFAPSIASRLMISMPTVGRPGPTRSRRSQPT